MTESSLPRTRGLDSGGRHEARAEPPRWLVVVALVAAAICVFLGVQGAVSVGITPDENYHVVRLQNYLDGHPYAVDEELAADGTVADKAYVYAPVTTLILHVGNVVLGNEDWSQVSSSTGAFRVRHLGVLALGMSAVLAVALTVGCLSGSRRWAVIGGAILLSMPTWTGHLMFNVKDTPVAAGYTVMTAGLVLMLSASRARHASLPRAITAGMVFVGTLLMVGTRPGMWTAALASLLLCLGVMTLTRHVSWASVAWTVAPFAMAVAVLAAIYPFVFAHPRGWWTAATASSDFSETARIGRVYIPAMLAVELPLPVLVLALVGCGTVAMGVIRWRPGGDATSLSALPVVAQAVLLPVIAIVLNSPLSGGLRQVLFLMPAVAILATLCLGRWALTSSSVRRWPLWSLTAVAIAVPTASQATVQPYQYSWSNVAADRAGIPFGIDYWRASFHEYVGRMPTDGPVICGARSIDGRAVAPSDGRTGDCRLDPLGPIASQWSERGLPVDNSLPASEFYAMFAGAALPRSCEGIDQVSRWRNGRHVVLSRLARCRGELELR